MTTRWTWVRRLPLHVAICIAPLALGGCGTSVRDLCEEACECEGCSERELDACIDNVKGIEDRARDAGCDDAFDDLLDCYGDEGACDGDDFEAEVCSPIEDELEDCGVDLG